MADTSILPELVEDVEPQPVHEEEEHEEDSARRDYNNGGEGEPGNEGSNDAEKRAGQDDTGKKYDGLYVTVAHMFTCNNR